MKILLDTHILIWVLENNKALSSHHKSILADVNNEKIVSSITFMEMAIKINIGKLPDFKISLKDFINMETKKKKAEKKKLPKDFKINPSLADKYSDQPLFKDKVDRANHILKTIGLPKKLTC